MSRLFMSRLALAGTLLLAALPARAADGKASDDCPQFGAGFKRVPGSDTCIQVSGAVRVDVGRGAAIGNAPNANAGTPMPPADPPAASDPWKQMR